MKKPLNAGITCLLLIAVLTTIVIASNIRSVNAQETTLSVIPLETNPAVGDTFIVNITVSNVEGMASWQIKLSFDNSKVTCLDAWVPPDGVFADKTNAVPKEINNDEGYILWGFVFYPINPEDLFNGSGVLCQIEFNCTSVDGVTFEFLNPEPPNTAGDTYLLDYDGNPIPFTPQGAQITVVPEFSSLVLSMFMLLTTSGIAMLRLKSYRVQRKK